MSPITLPLKPRLTSTTPLAMLKWTKIKSAKTITMVENNRNCAKLWKSIKLSKIVQNNHNRAKQSQLCKTVFEWFYKNLWMCVYYSLYSIQRLCAHSSWPWPKGKTRLQNKPQTYFPSLTLKSLKPPSFWRFHELDSPLTGVGLIGYVKSKPLGPGQIISIDVLV